MPNYHARDISAEVVRRAVDKTRITGQFLLSGSANLSILKNITESLAERAVYLSIHPMNRREVARNTTTEPFIKSPKLYLGQSNLSQGLVQLEHIEAIEKRLWNAADTLRSNSNYASNEYFMPVMGLIFLRYAYSRYLAVKADFVMANPPFNVGEVDADKVKNDPRPPFGLPGVNKNEKVSNGNYLWISYFYAEAAELAERISRNFRELGM